jgi:hypothetical protein
MWGALEEVSRIRRKTKEIYVNYELRGLRQKRLKI